MTNISRGEIEIFMDGRKWCMCLTLGALAELEQYFKCDNVEDLKERMSADLSANDYVNILGAATRGSGHQLTNDEIGKLEFDGGVQAVKAAISELLNSTFW